MRLENVVKSMRFPDDVLIVHVSEENIQSVLTAECTAVIREPESLKDKKSIVIKSKNGVIVAVGTIEEVTEYDSALCGHLWKRNNPDWKTLIKFKNVILIGRYVDYVFGSDTNIKYCETAMSLKEQEDVKNLIKVVEQTYMLNIKSFLAAIGLDNK